MVLGNLGEQLLDVVGSTDYGNDVGRTMSFRRKPKKSDPDQLSTNRSCSFSDTWKLSFVHEACKRTIDPNGSAVFGLTTTIVL
jgi:hypothetical protein